MSLSMKIMQQTAGIGSMLFGNAAGGLVYSTLLNNPERMNYYVRRGVVEHSTPGFYGYNVKLDDGTRVSCIPPDSGPGTLYGLGATDGSVITPGIEVLVAQSGIGGSVGAILCVCDNQTYSSSGKFRLAKGDEGAGAYSGKQPPYSKDVIKKLGVPSVGMYKISDSYPGDWAMFNEFGVGYFLGRTRATIRGSDMARIDLFPINDQMRVAAGYFQMYTHGGKRSVFAYNHGYVNEERLFSPYVWETAGCLSPGEFDSKLQIPDDTDSKLESLENPDLARYREYLGAVAGGRQIFTSCPSKDKKGNVGLSHVALSDSGAVVIRSVADIILSRTSQIDVPVRIRDPEKQEDKLDIVKKDEASSPDRWWKHDTGKRTTSNIVSQQYVRFKKNPDDWRIDSNKPESEYDGYSGSSGDRASNASSIVLGQDGSIVLSTAEGAEIRLSGKDITISCPGHIFFKSGKDVVTLAKGNIFEKSGHKLEMTSRTNMLFSAEGRVSTFAGKSVFTEVGKREKDDESPELFYADNGSGTRGIYFVTNDKASRFVVDTDHAIVHPRERIEIRSVDSDTEETPRNSHLIIGVGNVLLNSFNYSNVIGNSEDASAGLAMSGGVTTMFGRSVNVHGGSSVYVGSSTAAAQMMPIQGNANVYSDICDSYRQLRTSILFEKHALISEMPHFAYTNYNFDAPAFEESPWVNASGPDKVEPWGEELEVNGTLPWPGKSGKVEVYRQDQSGWKARDTDFGTREEQEKKVASDMLQSSVDFEDFKG